MIRGLTALGSPENNAHADARVDAGVFHAFHNEWVSGDSLPEMPVFLYPEMHVPVPLEATYLAAWETMPGRWQRVMESDA